MFRPLAIVAALCITGATTFGAAEPRTGAFTLGVLRRDGAIIPFAAFGGKRWSSDWPGPQAPQYTQVPINLASVPRGWWGDAGILDEWQLWPAAGGDPRTIRVTQPDWVDAHCLHQIVLKTDYRSFVAAPAMSEQPYPKVGLAIAPPMPLERVEVIAAGGSRAESLATGLQQQFNRAELDTDRRFGHPTPRRVREPLQPTIEALYAFGAAPTFYYIEASRGYRGMVEEECRTAFATGWFTRDGDTVKWLDLVVDLLPCNKYGATYMLPFGVIRAAGRVFWIAQYAGWDHERYVVIELKKKTVQAVVSAWGGGC
jgi:hypothetical protein